MEKAGQNIQTDANGKITDDGVHQYYYNANNRLIGFDDQPERYLYNAQGQRASKYSQTQYQLTADLNGNGLADPLDLSLLFRAMTGQTYDPRYDIDRNGQLDFSDYYCVLRVVQGLPVGGGLP